MTTLEDILSYTPNQHGEHGVDATLHRLAKKYGRIHEVFSNPPGGSWTCFDILRPQTGQIFRWDHIPRVPADAKRPDLVLQFNEGSKMNFLVIESKPSITDVYSKMGKLLTQFFTGSSRYLGLKDRPAWHFKRLEDPSWTFISPEDDEDLRFWFKKYDRQLINFWTGFAFAIAPEYFERIEELNVNLLQGKLDKVIVKNRDLNVVILVGWVGEHHVPFILRSYSDDFKFTRLASELNNLLSPCVLQNMETQTNLYLNHQLR